MIRSRFKLLFVALTLAMGTFVFADANPAVAQVSIGPGGISLGGGSVYIPFDNGYNDGRNRYYGPGGYYGPRDYFYDGRGPYGSGYGRSGLYWSPGVYWTPNNYWYGDRNWDRYDSAATRNWNSNRDALDFEVRGAGPQLPPLPELEELERMNWTHLRRVLSFGATQLEFGLDRLNTGSKWAKYLEVEKLQYIVANEEDVPPTPTQADQLIEMVKRYNQTADDERYASISGLWGFEAVHRGLSEFLQNPALRYRRQLAMNSHELDRALDRFATGPGWQQHLALPTELFVDSTEAEGPVNPPDPEKMREALQRYDEVAKNPAYRVINELPAFQDTHRSLARYLGRQDESQGKVASGLRAPAPPADPSLNAPEAVDPATLPQAGSKSDAAVGEKSVLQDPSNGEKPTGKKPARDNAVEELTPPVGDDSLGKPAPQSPAVREKK